MSFHQKLQDDIDTGSVKAFHLEKQPREHVERRGAKISPTTTMNSGGEKRHLNHKSASGVTPNLRGRGDYQPQHHKAKSSKHSAPMVTRTVHLLQPHREVTNHKPRRRTRNLETVPNLETVQVREQEQVQEVTPAQTVEPEPVQDLHVPSPGLTQAPVLSDCLALLREAQAALASNDLERFGKVVEDARVVQGADEYGEDFFWAFKAARDIINFGKPNAVEMGRHMIASLLGIMEGAITLNTDT
jgi:hypothetical protein